MGFANASLHDLQQLSVSQDENRMQAGIDLLKLYITIRIVRSDQTGCLVT